MIRSGRNVPTPAIPMPDFAVPYAAPIAVEDQPRISLMFYNRGRKRSLVHPNTIAAAMPP